MDPALKAQRAREREEARAEAARRRAEEDAAEAKEKKRLQDKIKKERRAMSKEPHKEPVIKPDLPVPFKGASQRDAARTSGPNSNATIQLKHRYSSGSPAEAPEPRKETVPWPQNAVVVPFIRWQAGDTAKGFSSERRKKRQEYERRGGRRAEQALYDTGPSPLDAFLPDKSTAKSQKKGKRGAEEEFTYHYPCSTDAGSARAWQGEPKLHPGRWWQSVHWGNGCIDGDGGRVF